MLTGSQLKQLQEALLSAFPSRDALRMMLRLELDINLDTVAGGDDLRVVVFKLVTWAESSGRIADLVAGAASQQPRNPDVKRLVQQAAGWVEVAAPPGLPGAPLQSERTTPAVIDIFLSYSHLDDATMRPLYAELRRSGFSVWIDDGLEPGTVSWQAAIQEAIRQARCMVLFMTPNARASTWVNNEVHYAAELGKHIVPLHAAGAPADAVPLLLFGAQRVDIRLNAEQAVQQKLLPALTRLLRPAAAQPPVRFDWVSIPAGEFLMGSDKQKDKLAYADELPQHRLTLPAYRIARTPVTVAQFAVFVDATGYKTTAEERGFARVWTGSKWDDVKGANWRHPRGPASDVAQKQDHPVTCVSWHDARAFCAWASSVTGETVRLPSEAEWEKAARGIDGRIYPWGDQPPTGKLCNFAMNVGDTTAVGSYPDGASPYGALDMAGNVWEWTATKWVDSYKNYQPDDNPDGSGARTLRGGSFDVSVDGVRCAFRGRNSPGVMGFNVGFRVVSPGF